jgi:hypothetical protein
MGFLGQRNTYLRDAWNVMDFIIVVTSWIPYLLPNIGGNASGLRTFRLLRPLRSINRFPGLKILVETILMAIPQLGNIMLLSSIYFLTFGIVGVQLWKGSFHNRCGSLQHVPVDGCNATVSGASCTTLQWLIAHGHQELHAQFVAHGYGDSSLFNSMSEEKVSQVLQNILPGVAGGVREELEIAIRIRDVMQKGAVCAAVADDNGGGHACAVYVVDAEDEQANGVGEAGFCNWDYAQELWTQEISGQWVYSPEKAAHEDGCSTDKSDSGLLLESCIQIKLNPYWDLISWDNILFGCVIIYQIITITSWQDYMYMTQQTSGFMVWIYFVACTLIGAYFLVNLFVAVLKEKFDAIEHAESMDDRSDSEEEEDDFPCVHCEFLHGLRYTVECPLEDIRAPETCQGCKDKLMENSSFVDQLNNLTAAQRGNPLIVEPGARVLCFKGVPISDEKLLIEVGVAPDSLVRLETSAMRLQLKGLVQHPSFTSFYTGMILLNTFVLAADHHQIDDDMAEALDSTNYALTLLFAIETMLKLGAYTPLEFSGDSFNTFDFFVVAAGLLEILAQGDDDGAAGAFRAFRIFRLFRVLRVLRLISFLEPLKKIGRVVLKTLGHLGYILTLLLLFTYIFTILGIQVFGGEFNFDGDVPRANFDSFIFALFTVVQVLTFDAWNNPMLDGVRAVGWGGSVYFLVWILLGSFVLLNLLLVIILDAYVEVAEEIKQEEARALIGKGGTADDGSGVLGPLIDRKSKEWADDESPMTANYSFANPMEATKTTAEVRSTVLSVTGNAIRIDREQMFEVADILVLRGEDSSTVVDEADISKLLNGNETLEIVQFVEWCNQQLRMRRGQKRDLLADAALAGVEAAEVASGHLGIRDSFSRESLSHMDRPWTEDEIAAIDNKSCGIFPMNSGIRKWCLQAAVSKEMDTFILVVIILNCLVMALETPHLTEGDWLFDVLFWSDLMFTLIFFGEMVIKIIALGFFANGDASYLKDGWNRLDFTIVVISLLDLTIVYGSKLLSSDEGSEELSLLQAFRLLRAFRPLRMLTKMKGLQMLVNSLLASVAALLNVLGVTVLIWLIFGILGINLFKGQFWHCTNSDVVGEWDCVGAYWDEESKSVEQARWVNPESNFDHIGNSLFSLYEISTNDEWIEVAYNGIDAVGVGYQPRKNAHTSMLFYFIAFIVSCNFVFLNLFIGVIYEEYVALKNEGIYSLTPDQKAWYNVQIAISHAKPAVKMTVAKGHRDDSREAMFKIVTKPFFDHFIMGAIMANCVVMSVTYYGEPTVYTQVCDVLNYVFTFIFTVEMCMKIFAFSFSGYWLDAWNRFDFLIVQACLVDILVSDIIQVESLSASVFRLFRIGRVIGRVARMFRVIKNVQSLNQIFQTLIESLGALFYMAILVLLIMFIASIMAMHLFGKVKYGSVLGPYANFESVPMGMLTLFGFATGDAVTPLTHDCMVQPPHCSEGTAYCVCYSFYVCHCEWLCRMMISYHRVCMYNLPELGDCGHVVAAKVFFVVYAFVMLFVVIEMFVNVIMEKFEEQAELAHLPITGRNCHSLCHRGVCLCRGYLLALSRWGGVDCGGPQ